MKIEELQIGDWYWIELEGAKYPMQVTQSIFTLSNDEIARFEPIPLTQKILEQNGFIEIDKDNVKDTATHVYLYVEDGEPEDGFAICGNDEYGYYLGIKIYNQPYPIFVGKYKASKDPNLMSYVYPTYNVKYVHKLQHILKDFEIEKEIIL